MIVSTVLSCLEGGASFASVAVGKNSREVIEALGALPEGKVKTIANPDYETTDMFHSILLGLRLIPRQGAFYVLPADMPAASRETFEALRLAMEESGASFARPILRGRRGHPILLDSGVIPLLESHAGGGGLRQALSGIKTVDVEVFDQGCLLDADTPEDYKALLALE
jgi:CTP:molybdopterin cytidylyltransferase MocA